MTFQALLKALVDEGGYERDEAIAILVDAGDLDEDTADAIRDDDDD